MVALRGPAWRSTTPVSRLERSDLSQTTPSSPAEVEVPSVQDLVGQLEAKEEQSRRRSSVGDRPSTPNFRAHPFRPLIPYSRTPSPSTVSKVTPLPKEGSVVHEEVCRGLKGRRTSLDLDRKAIPLVFTTAEGDLICQPDSRLSTPPVRRDDLGPDSKPRLPPSSTSQAVDSVVVDFENLPPLPDTPLITSLSPRMITRKSQNRTEDYSPLNSPIVSIRPIAPLSPLSLAVDSAADSSSIADPPCPTEKPRPGTLATLYQLDPSSTATFNTSVRDLIQEAPDSPIGGDCVEPMDHDRTVGTMVVRGKDHLNTPKTTSALQNTNKPLRSRSNYSESSAGPSRKEEPITLSHKPFANSERPATPQSEKSIPMVTAPDTPLFGRRNEFSDISDITFDGSPGSRTGVKDFAVVAEVTEVTGGDICPDCDLPTAGSDNGDSSKGFNLPNPGGTVSGSSAPGITGAGITPSGVAASNLPASGLSPTGVPASSVPTTVIPAPGVSLPDASSLPGVPGVPDTGGDHDLHIPGSNLPGGLAVPVDITGTVDPPKIPPPSKKRMALGKGKKKGQNAIRRGRRLLLRKPVLAVVIGRQLAGPTSAALKLVSKGTPVDPTALKEAAVPQAVPQPVPLPA
ncbi:hypothetical protein ONS96_007580 [Cadophora gregata f. sp. sojae]|nr:hypothetical protein ONS96_007580 [Cadophora gregata f. sp. sojae]